MATSKLAYAALVATALGLSCSTNSREIVDGLAADATAETAKTDGVDAQGITETLQAQDLLFEASGPVDVVPEDVADSPDTCQPDCDGKECGDDACGGTCGDCGPQGQCTDGLCVLATGQPCSTAADCVGAICLPTPLGKMCSQYCFGDPCPEAWTCEVVYDYWNEPTEICAPPLPEGSCQSSQECPDDSDSCTILHCCAGGESVDDSLFGWGTCVPVADGSCCGNGAVDFGEECDDGNQDDGGLCALNCKLPMGVPPEVPLLAFSPMAIDGPWAVPVGNEGVVAWVDGVFAVSPMTVVVQHIGTDGLPAGDAHDLDIGGTLAFAPALAGNGDIGTFAVAWVGFSLFNEPIQIASFGLDGGMVGAMELEESGARYNSGNVDIASLPDGAWAVAWYGCDEPWNHEPPIPDCPAAPYLARVDPDQSVADTPVQLAPAGGRVAVSTSGDGDGWVAWCCNGCPDVGTKSAMQGRRLVAGIPQPGTVLLTHSPAYLESPKIRLLADGTFVLAAARVSSVDPSVTVALSVHDASGDLLAELPVVEMETWQSDNIQWGSVYDLAVTQETATVFWATKNAGGDFDIRFRSMALDGTVQSPESVLNLTTDGYQVSPAALPLPGLDSPLVAWHSFDLCSGMHDVVARVVP